MAAVVENSMATVPDEVIVQLQEQMLLQPEAVDDAPASRATSNGTSDKPSTVQDSQRAYNTPTSSPKRPPRLSAARSAPEAALEAMMHATPSQEAFKELTRASSFHGFPGGDTQPMESQVYRDFTESMARSTTTTTPKKQVIKFQVSPDGKMTYETQAVDVSPKTCVEGDTGYIDLEWEPASQGVEAESSKAGARSQGAEGECAGEEDDDDDDDEEAVSSYVAGLLEDDGTQLQADDQARPQAMPETPSLAGQKHGRDGEVFTSSVTNKKTPGFTQMFGDAGKGPIMTATQLFGQTQAPSSPFGDGPRSDPIITRPSPNLHQQYTASSPMWLTTSPAAPRQSRLSSVTGEPKERYTSLRESQEQRATKLRQHLGLTDRFPEDIIEIENEDEHTDAARRRFESKRMKRVMSDNALHDWQSVRAPSRPSSRPTSSPKPRTTIDLVTPGTVKRKDDVEFDVSDDGNATDDEALAEANAAEDDHESVDEYDELAQIVVRSQGFVDESEDGDGDDLGSNFGDDIHGIDPNAGGKNTWDHRTTPTQPGHPKSGRFATQPSAIADSQPFLASNADTAVRRPDMRIPQSSLIPGSQYQGRTNVDQPHSNSAEGSAHGVSSTYDDRVPSSPPLPTKAANRRNTGATGGKAPIPQRSSLPQASKLQVSSPLPLEVPESDITMPDGSVQDWSDLRTTSNGDSNGYQPYSTAQTHMAASGPLGKQRNADVSPFKPYTSQQSRTSQTPRTAAGVRRFADIANPVSSLRVSGESEDVDVDAIMSDVITADDQEVLNMMGSPTGEKATKRRQTLHKSSDISTTSPPKRVAMKSRGRNQVPSEDGAERTSPPSLPAQPRVDEASHILQDSLSKANELRGATPPAGGIPNSTPDSVRKRETAGANAASHLLLRRTGRTPKPSVLGIALKAQPAKKTKKKRLESRTGVEELEAADASAVIDETVLEDLGDRGKMFVDEPENHTAEHGSTIAHVQKPAAARLDQSKQVFALFKGSFNNFYPATWLGTSPDGRNHRVGFADGNVTELDPKHVRKFELRPGDVVKVDLREMRSKAWVVDRLGDTAEDDVEQGADAKGYNTIHVRSKASRTSSTTTEISDSTIEIPTESIYLTHTMWIRFADREFVPPGAFTAPLTRPSTPSVGVRTPNADSPASRSRRAVIPTVKALGTRPTSLREESVVSSTPPAAQGLFSGMAFAISYGSHEAEKVDVSRMITRNGGVILGNGFDELFLPPSLDEPAATSPPKKSGPPAELKLSEDTSLQLKPEYESLGFVALIADKHSRRAKYVQALALGLPTLSGKWLTDSLDSSKNGTLTTPDASPLPWSRYLLPAGESAYLNGATRSRTMPIYDPGDAKLADIIESRDILLNGDGVLIVVPKRSKAVWERRKAYAFLTLALGACGVKRVSDLDEAKAFVHGEVSKWKWVYVEGSVADASKVLFARSDGERKRKRDGNAAAPSIKVEAKAMSASDGKVRIVNDEFVIQSLILGALVD